MPMYYKYIALSMASQSENVVIAGQDINLLILSLVSEKSQIIYFFKPSIGNETAKLHDRNSFKVKHILKYLVLAAVTQLLHFVV